MKRFVIPGFIILSLILTVLCTYVVVGLKLKNNPRLVSNQIRIPISILEAKRQGVQIKPYLDYFYSARKETLVEGSMFGWKRTDTIISDHKTIYATQE